MLTSIEIMFSKKFWTKRVFRWLKYVTKTKKNNFSWKNGFHRYFKNTCFKQYEQNQKILDLTPVNWYNSFKFVSLTQIVDWPDIKYTKINQYKACLTEDLVNGKHISIHQLHPHATLSGQSAIYTYWMSFRWKTHDFKVKN